MKNADGSKLGRGGRKNKELKDLETVLVAAFSGTGAGGSVNISESTDLFRETSVTLGGAAVWLAVWLAAAALRSCLSLGAST